MWLLGNQYGIDSKFGQCGGIWGHVYPPKYFIGQNEGDPVVITLSHLDDFSWLSNVAPTNTPKND